MNTGFFLGVALVLHIIGLAMVAGTTLTNYMILGQFWKMYAVDKQKGVAIMQATKKFPMIMGIGFGLLVITGITMVALVHGAFAEQLWFKLKMPVVLIVIGGGLAVGRRNGMRLRDLIKLDMSQNNQLAQLHKMKNRLYGFIWFQMLFILVIFVLSAFRFM